MNKKIALFFLTCLAIAVVILSLRNLKARQDISRIMLSEICSKNQTVVYDRDGEYSDYIELYNPTGHAIDISGYKVSDKKDFENAYTIEDSVIESGEYKVIFPKQFGISDNETIYLSDAAGDVIDSVKVPVLEADFSYAKNMSQNRWNIMQATPGAENLAAQPFEDSVSGGIAAPKFSAASGFYEEPFYLEIEVPEGTEVYYTLDGTEPTTESALYREPIYIEDVSYKENVYASIDDISTRDGVYIPYHLVDKINVVRAIAVDSAGKQSFEAAGSYFVGYEEKPGYNDIYIVSIITDPANLFSFENGIYVKGKVWAANWDEEKAEADPAYKKTAKANYTMEGKGWRREAYLEVYGRNGQLQYEQQIQIGIHGGWSVAHNQKSFNLYALPEKDGNEYLCEGLLSNTETTLMLRAGGYRDLFSTKFRDVLNERLVENRHVGILRAIPCQVFLDGEYWGLYNFQERIDGSYVESNYGVPKENVVILKNKEVIEGEEADYQLYASVLEFAENNDLSDPENYEKIKQSIDIESYIDYYCFQIYVANCDSIDNNYSLWRSKTVEDNEYQDGRWRWILYDTDDSAGMVDSGSITKPEVNSFVEGYWGSSPLEDLLFSSLFQNEEFRTLFAQTFIEMAEENFAPDRVNAMIDELYEEYAKGCVLSHQRFIDGDYTEEQYIEELNIVRDFYNRRPDYILEYLYDILKQYE